jgi:hypothetical protein
MITWQVEVDEGACPKLVYIAIYIYTYGAGRGCATARGYRTAAVHTGS